MLLTTLHMTQKEAWKLCSKSTLFDHAALAWKNEFAMNGISWEKSHFGLVIMKVCRKLLSGWLQANAMTLAYVVLVLMMEFMTFAFAENS